LRPARVDALVAGYQPGRTTKDLAAEFGINRRTVPVHLRRAGVPIRRGGLDHDQVAEAVGLYEAGWSSGRLAERFDVSADSVLKSLRRAAVSIRPRKGGPVPKGQSV
jgi:DNA-directed RNA polymerase specialized sigma24 family protein